MSSLNNELVTKKLQEVIDSVDNTGLVINDKYKSIIENLQKKLESNNDLLVIKLIKDSVLQSYDDKLVIKNIEIEFDNKQYEILEIDLEKFNILIDFISIKGIDLAVLLRLNTFIYNSWTLNDYTEMLEYFRVHQLNEMEVKLIRVLSIKNMRDYKIIHKLSEHLDNYKRKILEDIHNLL